MALCAYMHSCTEICYSKGIYLSVQPSSFAARFHAAHPSEDLFLNRYFPPDRYLENVILTIDVKKGRV